VDDLNIWVITRAMFGVTQFLFVLTVSTLKPGWKGEIIRFHPGFANQSASHPPGDGPAIASVIFYTNFLTSTVLSSMSDPESGCDRSIKTRTRAWWGYTDEARLRGLRPENRLLTTGFGMNCPEFSGVGPMSLEKLGSLHAPPDGSH
jgi:hypothetical protein